MLFRNEEFECVDILTGFSSLICMSAEKNLSEKITLLARDFTIVDLQFSYDKDGNPCALVLYRNKT
jgi:hypothetical protein